MLHCVCQPGDKFPTGLGRRFDIQIDKCDVCRAPQEMRLQHEISPDCDYRLALTSWANGRFDVIPSFTPAEHPFVDV